MSDLNIYLQTVEGLVTGATKGFMAKLDHMTFKMVINGLKGEDYQAVSIVIDQLVKEHRPVSIPPLYVVAQKHPNPRIREKALVALNTLDKEKQVEKLTVGKSMQDAVKSLVEHFGNFKQSP
jgi:hypothetical protein